MSEDKFAESLQLAQVGMFNLLENDVSWPPVPGLLFSGVFLFQVEQVSQLATFAEGLLDYHSQCTDILRILVETLGER